MLAIPFLVILALMLGSARKLSFVFTYLFTAVAFVVAVESVNFATRQLGVVLALKDSKCVLSYVDHIIKNYAPADIHAEGLPSMVPPPGELRAMARHFKAPEQSGICSRIRNYAAACCVKLLSAIRAAVATSLSLYRPRRICKCAATRSR
jgi:hypothetical protein